MPRKGRKNTPVYPDTVLNHPSVAPLHAEWQAKASALQSVVKIGRNSKAYQTKLDAQLAAEVAKSAFEAAVSHLVAERQEIGAEYGTGEAKHSTLHMSLEDGVENGATADATALQTRADEVPENDANMSPPQSPSVVNKGQTNHNLDVTQDIEMLTGTSSYDNTKNALGEPSARDNTRGESDEQPMDLDTGSELSSPPASSPVAPNASLPEDIDIDSIIHLQHSLHEEIRHRAENENKGALGRSVSPVASVGVPAQLLELGAAHSGVASGFQATFETALQGLSTGSHPPLPVAVMGGGTINPAYLNLGSLSLAQIQALAGIHQERGTPLAPSVSPAPLTSSVPPNTPPAIQAPATQHVNHPTRHDRAASPAVSVNNADSKDPPSNQTPPGQVPPTGEDTMHYYPPVPRPDILLNIPLDKLQQLRSVRSENYGTSAELARATELYKKHAILMCPDDIYVENELLQGIPESVANLYEWARVCNYEQLCQRDQFVLQARGRAAIEAYVQDLSAERARIAGTGITAKKILLKPTWVRTLAMRFACYLPEAGTTSYDVSLAFLRDKVDQYKCLNHHKQRAKGTVRRDAVIGAGHKRAGLVELAGVGYPHRPGKLSELDGHLNCGCSVKDALIEIYLFKTMLGYSTNPRFDHLDFRWEPDTIIPTHVRAFLVSLFRQLTGLDGDSPELYTGVIGWGPCAGEWASEDHLDTMKLQALKHALTACLASDNVNVYPVLEKCLANQTEVEERLVERRLGALRDAVRGCINDGIDASPVLRELGVFDS